MGRARQGQRVQLRVADELLAWVDGQVEDAGHAGLVDPETGRAWSRSTVLRIGLEQLRRSEGGGSRPTSSPSIAAAARERAAAFRGATQ